MTTSGYGLQANLTTNQFLIFISFSRKKHVCCREFYSKYDKKQKSKAPSFYKYGIVLGIRMLVNSSSNQHISSSYSSLDESIITEGTMQYIIKDRIENFDDYILCRKERCKLNHVTNWFCMFVDTYNNSMTS